MRHLLLCVCGLVLSCCGAAAQQQDASLAAGPPAGTRGSSAAIEELINSGLLERARERLAQRVAREGESAYSLLLEAMILRKESRYVESLKKTQASLEKNPYNADVHKLFGLNLVSLGKAELAGPYFRQAVKLAPEDAKARYYLGLHLLTGKKEPELAEQEFRKALKADPGSVDARCMLGVALEEQGRNEEAVAAYRQAIRVAGRRIRPNEKPYLFLGRLLFSLERPEEAVPVLEQALDLNPRSQEAAVALGRSLARLGRVEEALEALRTAAELDPADKSPHYLMMRLYKQQGRMKEAAREMRIFRRLQSQAADRGE